MTKGYIHVYTGNAKGKTTAALGLALRAAGAGMRIFIAQFIKNRRCSEHIALERFSDLITLKQYGTGFIKKIKNKGQRTKQVKSVLDGLDEVSEIIASGKYDMVILDEINVAMHLSLIDVERVIDIIDKKPPHVELILTGRYADERIIQRADLVTEMSEIKHYYKKGVKARRGIEH